MPISQRPYRTPYARRQLINQEIQRMLALDVIEPSISPWSSPVIIVEKPDGKPRFCADYRRLNTVTKKDVFPLKRIDEIFDALHGACYFTTLDLSQAFWQIDVAPEDREKTTFTTEFGNYQFK